MFEDDSARQAKSVGNSDESKLCSEQAGSPVTPEAATPPCSLSEIGVIISNLERKRTGCNRVKTVSSFQSIDPSGDLNFDYDLNTQCSVTPEKDPSLDGSQLTPYARNLPDRLQIIDEGIPPTSGSKASKADKPKASEHPFSPHEAHELSPQPRSQARKRTIEDDSTSPPAEEGVPSPWRKNVAARQLQNTTMQLQKAIPEVFDLTTPPRTISVPNVAGDDTPGVLTSTTSSPRIESITVSAKRRVETSAKSNLSGKRRKQQRKSTNLSRQSQASSNSLIDHFLAPANPTSQLGVSPDGQSRSNSMLHSGTAMPLQPPLASMPMAVVTPISSSRGDGWDRWPSDRDYELLEEGENGSELLALPPSVPVLDLDPTEHKVHLVGGVDSLSSYADNLHKLADSICRNWSVLKVGCLTNRYDTEENSRLKYSSSEEVAPQSHGTYFNQVPIHFCPNYKIGTWDTRMPGIAFHIRMYLLQDEFIASRYITEYELAVMNAAMNVAITCPGDYSYFLNCGHGYRAEYIRNRNCLAKFESKSGTQQKYQHYSSCTNVFRGRSASIFLKLINEVIVDIADSLDRWIFDYTAECWHGLYGQGNLSPVLLRKAARNILRKSVFVAEAVGVKDRWQERLTHYDVPYDNWKFIDRFATANSVKCVEQLKEFFPPQPRDENSNTFLLFDIGLNLYPNTHGHSLSLDGNKASQLSEKLMKCTTRQSLQYVKDLFRGLPQHDVEDCKFF